MNIKVCQIGCGDHAHVAHGPSLKKYAEIKREVELAACCDLNEDKAAAFAQSFGFKKYFTDYKAMILTVQPHAVVVVMPIHITASVLSEIIKLGCPVLIEKPPAENLSQLDELIRLSRLHSAKVQVAFNRRYCPLINVLAEEIHNHGKIQYLRYDMFRIQRTEADFHMTAIHGIDAVRHILKSDYDQLDIKYTWLPEFGPGVKNIYLAGTMKNGIAVNLNFCPVSGEVSEKVTVSADDATFYLDIPMWNVLDNPGSLCILKRGMKKNTISGQSVTPESAIYTSGGFYDENRAFLETIINKGSLYPTLEDSYQSLEIARCIEMKQSQYNANH